MLGAAPPEPLSRRARRPSAQERSLPATGAQMCPSCQQMLPAGAKICVNCGIYLKTGRSILTTQDESLDQIYVYVERTVWLISWIIWAGIYPIASEAFGLRKPWTVRGIALVTVIVSVLCLVAEWTEAPAWNSIRHMQLWAGDPAAGEQLLARLDREMDLEGFDDPQLREQARAMARAMVEEHLASACEFRPLQLVTHAFLHGGILHLAGNMLFLMVLGTRVNALIGNIWALALYPVLAVIAGIAHTISVSSGPPIPMVGASGAIMGLAGMYLVLFPVHRVHMAAWFRWGLLASFRLSLKMFAVRGFWVVLFYIAFDVVYTVFGLEDETAHWAHLGGFIGGVAIALILLITRRIDARGGDLLSAIFGRHAWKIIGRPGQRAARA